MPARLTTEIFIANAKEKHGNIYDYSKCKYVNSQTEVIIICKNHGEFFTNPRYHLRKNKGCPKCYSENHVLNLDGFIKKAKTIHGDKYDYSKCIYTKLSQYMDFICKKHGIFSQIANSHLSGKGCPKCCNTLINLTKDEFITKATALYIDKYDYRETIFKDIDSKIKIFCNKHKEYFTKTARQFLNKCGCPKCGRENASLSQIKSQETFINEAKLVHNNKYSYEKTKYLGSKKTIEIICPFHGSFTQLASHHLQGHGCIQCMGLKSSIAQISNKETFIERAIAVHKNKYNYDSVIYTGCDNKVKIYCNNHKTYFNQSPYHHVNSKSGCPLCGREIMVKARRLDINNLIQIAGKIHKNKYDYSKVIYHNCDEKVEIICPKLNHGSYFQAMYSHITKRCGCPKCYGRISAIESRWLEENNVPNNKNNRQVNIVLNNGKRINVDGYIPETKTIYEFFGDYWHGNIKIYHKNRINIACNKTYLELYNETMNRIKNIKASGYNLIFIWESEFKNKLKTTAAPPQNVLPT